MSKTPTRALEQLRSGNALDYLAHKQKQLDETNLLLHSVVGEQALGQAQGRAAALQELLGEYRTAGIRF